jgi:hypothetical protein
MRTKVRLIRVKRSNRLLLLIILAAIIGMLTSVVIYNDHVGFALLMSVCYAAFGGFKKELVNWVAQGPD